MTLWLIRFLLLLLAWWWLPREFALSVVASLPPIANVLSCCCDVCACCGTAEFDIVFDNLSNHNGCTDCEDLNGVPFTVVVDDPPEGLDCECYWSLVLDETGCGNVTGCKLNLLDMCCEAHGVTIRLMSDNSIITFQRTDTGCASWTSESFTFIGTSFAGACLFGDVCARTFDDPLPTCVVTAV